MRQHDLILALALTLCSGCTTEEAPNTAGVDIEPTQCGRGFIVISSDYQSTNVSLLDTSGKTVSESIISSGSADPGLTAALSGDVVAPTMTQQQDAFVLVDRFPAATLTWVDLKTAQVRTQLNVGTGFAANPQDYLHIGDSKGYVSRYERNPLAGQQPYDEGDDVLVIDPSTASIKARIGLEALREDGVLARPGRMVQSGKMAYVLLGMYSDDFMKTSEAKLVEIDTTTDEVRQTVKLAGLHGCSALAIDETSRFIAVGCSGRFAGMSSPSLEQSGVAVLEIANGGLSEVQRWSASDLGQRPVGFWLDFSSPKTLLVSTFGREASASESMRPDALFSLTLGSTASEVRKESDQLPFSLGDVRCATPTSDEAPDEPRCGRCVLADAERGVIHVSEPGLDPLDEARVVEQQIGLPPRTLGRF